jgi:phosphinothricin acetyltransferase
MNEIQNASGGSMQIRDAAEADFDQITAIYNEVLINSTAIYNDHPASTADRIAWWKKRLQQVYPVLAATDRSRVVGFASCGDFRSWAGHRFTVECAVHIHSGWRGQGLGTALLSALITRTKTLGKHTMIAAVDSENVASLQFFERCGFERAGYLREVGYKFGRYLDLVFLQYWITPHAGETR